jgi:acyl dehydratase
MATKEGWRGRFYEDFEVGDVYQHPLGRTVTTTDNIWFTLLTQNTAPIHFDHHYAAQTEFGKPLLDSTFTLALVTGRRPRQHPQPCRTGSEGPPTGKLSTGRNARRDRPDYCPHLEARATAQLA